MFHVIEESPANGPAIPVTRLASQRRIPEDQAKREAADLEAAALAIVKNDTVAFTDPGWKRACEIVRNHRLWELYLTHAADIAPDHVHDDAEKIEHILGADVVMELEKRLNYSKLDPHGRSIPGKQEIEAGAPA